MGVGVAQNLAETGHEVVLLDVGEPVLERARQELARNLRFGGLFRKKEEGSPAQPPPPKRPPASEVLARVRFTTDPGDLSAADFVIENATEKWEIKREVYA